MKKIIRDFELLKEQGCNPHIWLECHTKGDDMYFDGQYDKSHLTTQDTPPDRMQMYVHIMDIENFSVDSLETLYLLNYDTEVSPPDMQVIWSNSYARIIQPELIKNIVKLKNGIYYHKPTLELQKGSNKEVVTSHFNPVSFESNLDVLPRYITLYSKYSEDVRQFRFFQHYYILREYAKKLKGLSAILDEFDVLFTAQSLGNCLDGIDYTTQVNFSTNNYVAPTKIPYKFCQVLLPSLEFVEIKFNQEYFGSGADGFVVQDKCDDICNFDLVENITARNKFSFCEANNILALEPICVSKVTFENNKLDIMVYCAAKLGRGLPKVVEAPLHLIRGNAVYNEYYNFEVQFSYGSVKIPQSYMSYLDTSLTMEKFIEKNFLSSKIPVREYKSIQYVD